jgi:hypothetical protein
LNSNHENNENHCDVLLVLASTRLAQLSEIAMANASAKHERDQAYEDDQFIQMMHAKQLNDED